MFSKFNKIASLMLVLLIITLSACSSGPVLEPPTPKLGANYYIDYNIGSAHYVFTVYGNEAYYNDNGTEKYYDESINHWDIFTKENGKWTQFPTSEIVSLDDVKNSQIDILTNIGEKKAHATGTQAKIFDFLCNEYKNSKGDLYYPCDSLGIILKSTGENAVQVNKIMTDIAGIPENLIPSSAKGSNE